jgi:hypothetical protein
LSSWKIEEEPIISSRVQKKLSSSIYGLPVEKGKRDGYEQQ